MRRPPAPARLPRALALLVVLAVLTALGVGALASPAEATRRTVSDSRHDVLKQTGQEAPERAPQNASADLVRFTTSMGRRTLVLSSTVRSLPRNYWAMLWRVQHRRRRRAHRRPAQDRRGPAHAEPGRHPGAPARACARRSSGAATASSSRCRCAAWARPPRCRPAPAARPPSATSAGSSPTTRCAAAGSPGRPAPGPAGQARREGPAMGAPTRRQLVAGRPPRPGRSHHLVTGPTIGGLGHVTALELVRRGARVVLAGRSEREAARDRGRRAGRGARAPSSCGCRSTSPPSPPSARRPPGPPTSGRSTCWSTTPA